MTGMSLSNAYQKNAYEIYTFYKNSLENDRLDSSKAGAEERIELKTLFPSARQIGLQATMIKLWARLVNGRRLKSPYLCKMVKPAVSNSARYLDVGSRL